MGSSGSRSCGPTLGAKSKLDELEDALNSNGDRPYGDEGSGGRRFGVGGRLAVGGAAGRGGTYTREADALRKSTFGCVELGEAGDSNVVHEALRLRVKTTGDGDGVLEDEGEEEPDSLR